MSAKKVLLQDFKNTSTYFDKLSDKTLELIKSMYDINDREKPLFESHKNIYARHLQKALNFLFNKNSKVDRKQKVVQHSLRHIGMTPHLSTHSNSAKPFLFLHDIFFQIHFR